MLAVASSCSPQNELQLRLIAAEGRAAAVADRMTVQGAWLRELP